MSQVTFARWADIERERVTDMIDRKLITGDGVMLAHVFLKQGAIVPKHQHHNEQFTYILEGALKFLIGEDGAEEVIVRAGEVLHIPSNVWHEAEALEDTLDMDIFNPPRQDWLDRTDDYFHNAPSAPRVASRDTAGPADAAGPSASAGGR
ncbi:MAG TPA: cupin domain-containing protein [Longimicrobiales bacterium]|nr:cupin domain-containing protein [Longimicrobiales bacterium]